MARISPVTLRRYLLVGYVPADGCILKQARRTAQSSSRRRHHTTQAHDSSSPPSVPGTTAPFRKQLKDQAKSRGAREKKEGARTSKEQKLKDWELTVGIEIHAQLNTARKLFSTALSTINEPANTQVAFFDLAIPGSQPTFQKETLIPALRAALALNCKIQRVSKFDRKHYFHWDQPAGYQITQYYEPYAKDGYITLFAHDGIAAEDGDHFQVGIKQIQMEQDTAKTISLPGKIHLLDFNRVGLPLIEIITLPHIHHPKTAAALVQKVQSLLYSVDACVLGMESGGLRADVNVSVRRRDVQGGHGYSGIHGLGQRTEIKNLSSFKAVEEAIIAERDRQIQVLESGGIIEGETRGWTIGSSETKLLRRKEGEVDYRYMPDPDLAPVVIGEDLIKHLSAKLGMLPDDEIRLLVSDYGLSPKDAKTIISLEGGGRAEYLYRVVDAYLEIATEDRKRIGRFCANWVLHELGGLTHERVDEANPLGVESDGRCIIPAQQLARLLMYLDTKKITAKTAKWTLQALFVSLVQGRSHTVDKILDGNQLWFRPLSNDEYRTLAESVLDPLIVKEILSGKGGKINFLLGQMMRKDEDGRLDPQKAIVVLRELIEEQRDLK